MEEKAKQSTESLKSLIEKIENNDVVLPEFQRDFVWDISKSYELFDSLVKDIFIGSIIYGIPSFEITVREIDNRERRIKGKKRKKLKLFSYTQDEIMSKVKVDNFRLLLDGQQRITSLYRALKGMDDVWFISKNEDEIDEDLIDKDINSLPLEKLLYEFNGQEDISRLSIKISDVYDFMEKGLLEDEIKEDYFSKLKFIENKDDDEKRKYQRKYLIISRKFQDLFKAQKLLSYFLLDMNSEKFALFFERSNSLGVQLNFIDILVAKLYAGFNLREKVEEFYEQNGDKYSFDREIIVRTIAYIVSKGKNVDKGYILSTLTHVDFTNYWYTICDLYKKVINFLYDNNFIISQDWMPYENMTIPLIIFLNNLPSHDFCQMNEKQREFIHFWYWSSIFSQRYGGASNDVIIQDASVLRLIAQNRKIYDRSFFLKLRLYITNADDLYSYTKKGSSIYKGILNIINYYSGGLLDWQNSSRLTFNCKLEDHHIFPKEYLKLSLSDFDEGSDLVECVLNRTLIPKITNIKIGKKSPSKYLKELQSQNNNLTKCLKTHLIPDDTVDGLYDDFFEDFLKERANLIFSIISNVVLDKQAYILKEFYEPAKKISTNITVFARYYQKVVEATFNIETKEILYKGGKYSVSKAADIAKEDLSDKKNASTNGWKFWKYDDNGQERYIDDFRH